MLNHIHKIIYIS